MTADLGAVQRSARQICVRALGMRDTARLKLGRLACAAAGGATASVCRYHVIDAWNSLGLQLLTTLVVIAFSSWAVCAVEFKIIQNHRAAGVFAVGFLATMCSATAYIASGIHETPWAATGFLLLTPAAAALGLWLGLRRPSHTADRRARNP